ncbi:MAG: YicC family protein [Synergistaceae bacterium]|nr:YicC family protein [Synergistaceae bacterium]
MLLSMTGFGASRHEFAWGAVIVEVSSVNHKYQDFSVKLSLELASLENRAMTLMRTAINRGKVKLSMEIAWNPGSRIPVIDADSLMNFYHQLRKIAKRNGLETSNDIADFLNIRGVLSSSDNSAEEIARENPEIWDKIINDAISSLQDMKKSEGKILEAKINSDLQELEAVNKILKERWEIAQKDAIEALRSKIIRVMEYYRLEIDAPRIAQEIALLSDKWDVSEELDRFDAHIAKFRQIMKESESSGKKLDFLIQEMNREVNTMGSKVADAEFRWQVVEAKTCIEKIREQVQNVE